MRTVRRELYGPTDAPIMYSCLFLGSKSEVSRDSSLMFWRVVEACQMLQINVALPNGHAELLSLLSSSTVEDVRKTAQRTLGKKYLRLITAKNRVLVDPDRTLEEAAIKDGECLTALVLQPQLAAATNAFALWCHGDNAIVTWGDEKAGGDSWAVQDQLRGVQQIQATQRAFAAVLADGSVITWGCAGSGGDSLAVREQLRGVQQIQGICCDSGRWIRRFLGWCKGWWWQFGSSRSAQGCAADSGHTACICCDSGRWIRRYLGCCRVRWWQFGSSKCTQAFLVQPCMLHGNAWAVA